ncbi:uncharacterized protein LOC129792310 [Lutzomyia longipalpis]|uniref:uncharacterized protein LOC129792310 n=1 Tax=Lutzomyia longipalpis TaxID=7200 RepID=UPI0024839359|nr:uncharacterized protein LOC129792310 [Lutzomyia longipalpis]
MAPLPQRMHATASRRPQAAPRGPLALSRRPPLPPAISSRSQSLDGLLDMAGCDDAGNGQKTNSERAASEVTDSPQRRQRGAETDRGNRISRSLEDLLDEKPEANKGEEEDGNCSRSLESLLQDTPESPASEQAQRTASPGEKFCESETIVVDNALRSNDDTAYNSEEEKSSTSSRQGSISSDQQGSKRTFINRLGRRMKSLIKK